MALRSFMKRLLPWRVRVFLHQRYLHYRAEADRRRQFEAFCLTQAEDRRFASCKLVKHGLNQDDRIAPDRQYLLHAAWAARVLAETRPAKHVDFSSWICFGAIASAFVPMEYREYREIDLKIPDFPTGRADLTHLPFSDGGLPSVSCLHAIEHVGLGRYGDPIDVQGDLRAAKELTRVTAEGGHLLLAVPVSGTPRIDFNLHRVYSVDMAQEMFPEFELNEFAMIPEDPADGGLERFAQPSRVENQHYACGCFHFMKRAATECEEQTLSATGS